MTKATIDFYRTILNAIPLPIFIVEEDVRIVDVNQAASVLLDANNGSYYLEKSGDVLHCVHATSADEGCGKAPACRQCVIRSAVNSSLKGQTVARERTKAKLLVNGAAQEIELLVTTAPFGYENRKLALLIFEDITELSMLRSILPICSNCKKIRDDHDYWNSLESYFNMNLGIDFTHGICPDCIREFYPQAAGKKRD